MEMTLLVWKLLISLFRGSSMRRVQSASIFVLLLPVLTKPLFQSETDKLWEAKQVLIQVLTETATTRCSVFLYTDGATYASSIREVLRLAYHVTDGAAVYEMTTHTANFSHVSLLSLLTHCRQLRVLSWCVTMVVVSDDPVFLAAFALASDKGRLTVWETRLLVVTGLAPSHIQSLLQDYWVFSMMNTMFLTQEVQEKERWQLMSHLPYSPAGSQVVCVARWSLSNGLLINKGYTLFPEKYTNFHRMRVNVTVFPIPPHWSEVSRLEPNGGRVCTPTGRDYLIIETIAEALNFSINPLPFEGWDSLMVRLTTREALIRPINLPIMPVALERYDFSFFLEPSTLAFSMAKPTLEPRWQSLYYPLQAEVWGSIVIAVVVVFPVLVLMTHGSEDENPTMWVLVKQVVGTLLDEAIHGELPRKIPTRVVLVAWLIFAFVVGTVYRSNLTACLTSPKYPPRAETLDDLVALGHKVTTTIDMVIFAYVFETSDSEVMRKFSELIEYVPSYKEGMLKILTENKAHMYERLYLETKVAEGFTNKDGWTPLYVTQGSLMPGYAAFPLIKDAPFKANIDQCLVAIHGAGLINHWTEEVIRKVQQESREKMSEVQPQEEEMSSDNGIMALTVVHMQGPLLLYLTCTFISFAVFMREMTVRMCHHRLHTQRLLLC